MGLADGADLREVAENIVRRAVEQPRLHADVRSFSPPDLSAFSRGDRGAWLDAPGPKRTGPVDALVNNAGFEVQGAGIRVHLIEPGRFSTTGFHGNI